MTPNESSPITLRPLLPGDYAGWRPLWDGYNAMRGRGVARRLIEVVYNEARAAGATRVYWHTQESNSTARMLYDKVAKFTGFIVYIHEL